MLQIWENIHQDILLNGNCNKERLYPKLRKFKISWKSIPQNFFSYHIGVYEYFVISAISKKSYGKSYRRHSKPINKKKLISKIRESGYQFGNGYQFLVTVTNFGNGYQIW